MEPRADRINRLNRRESVKRTGTFYNIVTAVFIAGFIFYACPEDIARILPINDEHKQDFLEMQAKIMKPVESVVKEVMENI